MSAAAILFATVATEDTSPAAALRCGDTTLLGRLLAQLGELGVGRVGVITRPGWESEIKASVAHTAVEVDVRTSANTGADLLALAEVASTTQQQPLVVGSAEILKVGGQRS